MPLSRQPTVKLGYYGVDSLMCTSDELEETSKYFSCKSVLVRHVQASFSYKFRENNHFITIL